MGRRWQRVVAEVAKFLTVGGVATLFALVIFNGLVHGYFGGPGPMYDLPLVAYLLANTAGMVVSYRGSRSWAFRHREAVGAAGGRIAYFGINTATMAIPMACLAVSRYVLDLDNPVADNISANVIGLALGTAARFWAFRRFIFRTPAKARRKNRRKDRNKNRNKDGQQDGPSGRHGDHRSDGHSDGAARARST